MTLSLKLQRALIEKGYFPKELPPTFTTKSLGENIIPILRDWEATGAFRKEANVKKEKIQSEDRIKYYGLPKAEPETISIPKRGYERRDIHITHPIPQMLLATEIASNWKTIRTWLNRQTFSDDKIRLADAGDRAIRGINFPRHEAKKVFIDASSNWLLKTDISRFYTSIYTHSIAWAAYGKNEVKSNMQFFNDSLADRLDVLTRSCNQNQTIGLPIGPDTSRILAEIISSRIDADFLQKIRKVIKNFDKKSVHRHQDDWLIGCSSLAEAECMLSCIEACYREYGLQINGAKTRIDNVKKSVDSSWRAELTAHLVVKKEYPKGYPKTELPKGGRLSDFFALATRQQIENPTAPVLNYVLAIVEGQKFENNEISAVESFLLKAALVSPISLNRICRILLNLNFTNGISKKRISKRLLELIDTHTDTGALYEIIWLLYALRGLRHDVKSRRLAEFSAEFPSSALRLLLLDMDNSGLIKSRIAKDNWDKEISAEKSLKDWSWLYSYESVRKGWLKGPKSLLDTPFFGAMNARDITFYDARRNIPFSISVNKVKKEIRRTEQIEAKRTLGMLRGKVDQKVSDFLLEFSDI